ncbi:hypothetical protein HHX47_DHR6000721 [Lentinula edodes]|nr:hypothetical protein HHX47_DHR6000721 [Lentinula edodes]
MSKHHPGDNQESLLGVFAKSAMGNARYAIRTFARRPWYAYATNVISVLTVVDASFVDRLESPMRIIVLNVQDLRKTETAVPKS